MEDTSNYSSNLIAGGVFLIEMGWECLFKFKSGLLLIPRGLI
jgi:hypothetical protein